MHLIFKKKFFYLFFLLFCLKVNSQNNTIDNLLKELKTHKEKDTVKVNILNDLAWEFTRKDSEKALEYAMQAEKISSEISFKRGLITSNVRIGTVAIYQKKMIEAESIFLDVLKEEEKENYLYGIARAQNQLGRIYYSTNKYDESLKYYKKALGNFKILGKKLQLALVNNNIGVIYKKIGKYNSAVEYYLNSLAIRRELKDKKRTAFSLSNLGSLFIVIEDYEKAIKYLNESEIYLTENNQLYELSKVYTNLGIAFFQKNNELKAISYYEKTIDLNEKLGFLDKNIAIYNNLGNLYYQKDDLNKASDYYHKNLSFQNKHGFEKNKPNVYYNLGNIEFKKQVYLKAIEFYQKALKLAKASDNVSIILESRRNLSLSYSLIKVYDKAFKYSSDYSQLKDSLESASKKAIILTSNFEEEQLEMELLVRDKQIIQSKLDKTKIKNIALVVIFFSVIIILLLVIRGNKQKRKVDEIEKLLKNQELKSINAMIEGQEGERQRIAKDLHDSLGSMLSMVKVHFKSVEENIEKLKSSNRKQYKKANELLDSACDEVRKISHNISSSVLTKFGLVAALEDLKETLEESKKIKVEFVAHALDDRLDNTVEITIYRIIQELVSNVLKYANADNITIQIMNREKDLFVSVEDDGVGFNSNDKYYKGMGHKNVASRVDSLNGELRIDSTVGKGTSISFEIPLEKNLI